MNLFEPTCDAKSERAEMLADVQAPKESLAPQAGYAFLIPLGLTSQFRLAHALSYARKTNRGYGSLS